MNRELLSAAQAVLRINDAGNYTRPGPNQYPHQWNWDSAVIALSLSHFNLPRALQEIRSLLRGQWRDGMLPHIVYHQPTDDYFPSGEFWQTDNCPQASDILTSGITQPPLLTSVLLGIHQRTPVPDFVKEAFPAMMNWHRWLHSARDADGSGLACLIHPWESGTDDSPRWLEAMSRIQPDNLPEFQRRDTRFVQPIERPFHVDYERFIYLIDVFRKARYEPDTLLKRSPFLVQDVFFNALLYQADHDLRLLALELGKPVSEIDGWINRIRANFDSRFWDDGEGLYYDYDLRAGTPIRVNSATTFAPLYAGLATMNQAERLVEEHWLNAEEYAPGGEIHYRLTSTSRNEAAWEARRYWRGPVWILLNWLVYKGLRRYGYSDLAGELRRDSLDLMAKSGFREYYDPTDGYGCGSIDFSWSAGLAIIFMDELRTGDHPGAHNST